MKQQRTLTLNKDNVTTNVKLGDFDILQFFDVKVNHGVWGIGPVEEFDHTLGPVTVDITNGGIGLFRDENNKVGFILVERTAYGWYDYYRSSPSAPDRAEAWVQKTGYHIIPIDEGFNEVPKVMGFSYSSTDVKRFYRVFIDDEHLSEGLQNGKTYPGHSYNIDEFHEEDVGRVVYTDNGNRQGFVLLTKVFPGTTNVEVTYYTNELTPSGYGILLIDSSATEPFIRPNHDINQYNGMPITDDSDGGGWGDSKAGPLCGPSTMTFFARYPADDSDVECIYWLPFNKIENYPRVMTCFIKGQKVQLASGEMKAIEDIQVGDMVAYISDNGEPMTNEVLLPPQKGVCSEYTLYRFSNGTELKIYKSQGIWHEGDQKYRNIEEFNIGDKTKTINGEIIELIAIEQVVSEEELEHYFLYTYFGNYSVNGILTCTDRAKAMIALLQPENEEFKKRINAADWRLLKKQVQERFDRLRGHFNPKLARLNGQVASEKEKLAERIRSYEHLLNSTDYHVIKYMDGVLADDEYAPVKQNRITWRQRINELEAQRTDLDNFINGETERYKLRYTHPMFAAVPAHSIITMADGSTTAVEDVRHTDKVATLNGTTKMALEPLFYNVWDYHKLTFSNGSVLTALVNDLGIYSLDRNDYVDIMSLAVGEKVLLADGSATELVSVEFIEDHTYRSFYQIGTKSGEFIANGFNLKVLNDKIYETVYHPENAYYAAKWDED